MPGPDERPPLQADEAPFSAVPWLPPFRLGPRVLLQGELEVTLPPDGLVPFAQLRPDPAALAFRPYPPGEAAALADRHGLAGLRMLIDALPPGDTARARRWSLSVALAAAQATASLQQLGSVEAWIPAAAMRRTWYLQALDRGMPPPAEEVAAACRTVPHALRGLGNTLPTAEAVRLLQPLGRVVEVGAGFGLVSRALERAGLAVAASDADASPRTGIGFPVRHGLDAVATLAHFAAAAAPPPILMIWPQFDEGDWFADVVAHAAPGQHIAIASPELEFCAAGGLAEGVPAGAGPGWRVAGAVLARLAAQFDQVGEAPVVAAGWPAATTPLRLWRRR
jgi:hypothetical protein